MKTHHTPLDTPTPHPKKKKKKKKKKLKKLNNKQGTEKEHATEGAG
jgi:hypothetical protein